MHYLGAKGINPIAPTIKKTDIQQQHRKNILLFSGIKYLLHTTNLFIMSTYGLIFNFIEWPQLRETMDLMPTICRQAQFANELNEAETRPRWLAILTKIARHYGLSYASILRTPKPAEERLGPLVLESNIPLKFVQQFDQNSLLRVCPILPKFDFSILPIQWTLEEDYKPYEKCHMVTQLLNDFNITTGFMVPITSISGERFIIRYDGDASNLLRCDINELYMLSTTAFECFEKLRRSENFIGKALTKRELEAVRWTAQGKTSTEIAQILSLSDHTVNAYMNNAIKKLECVNRTQLVAKAIRLKLID